MARRKYTCEPGERYGRLTVRTTRDPAEQKRVIGEQVQRASDIMRMVKIMADKTEGIDRSVASDAKRLTRSLDNLTMSLL